MHLAPAASMALFLMDCRSRQLSPRTVEHYVTRLTPFVHWLENTGVTVLAAVTAAHIRAYLVERQQIGNAATTVHTEARAIRAFLNWCVGEGFLSSSPMPAMPQRPRLVKSAVPMRDIRKLFKIADRRETVILLLLLDTGMRASELTRLDVDDIDCGAGAVMVRQGKGGKDRQCYIGAKTIKALLYYWAQAGINTGAAVRTERGGRRLTRNNLLRTIYRIAQRAGVRGISTHALRRTFAIEHLRNGVDLYTLARLMGHSNIDSLRHYLDLVDNDIAEAHRRYTLIDNL